MTIGIAEGRNNPATSKAWRMGWDAATWRIHVTKDVLHTREPRAFMESMERSMVAYPCGAHPLFVLGYQAAIHAAEGG